MLARRFLPVLVLVSVFFLPAVLCQPIHPRHRRSTSLRLLRREDVEEAKPLSEEEKARQEAEAKARIVAAEKAKQWAAEKEGIIKWKPEFHSLQEEGEEVDPPKIISGYQRMENERKTINEDYQRFLMEQAHSGAEGEATHSPIGSLIDQQHAVPEAQASSASRNGILSNIMNRVRNAGTSLSSVRFPSLNPFGGQASPSRVSGSTPAPAVEKDLYPAADLYPPDQAAWARVANSAPQRGIFANALDRIKGVGSSLSSFRPSSLFPSGGSSPRPGAPAGAGGLPVTQLSTGLNPPSPQRGPLANALERVRGFGSSIPSVRLTNLFPSASPPPKITTTAQTSLSEALQNIKGGVTTDPEAERRLWNEYNNLRKVANTPIKYWGGTVNDQEFLREQKERGRSLYLYDEAGNVFRINGQEITQLPKNERANILNDIGFKSSQQATAAAAKGFGSASSSGGILDTFTGGAKKLFGSFGDIVSRLRPV